MKAWQGRDPYRAARLLFSDVPADQDGSLSSPLSFVRLPEFEQQSFAPSRRTELFPCPRGGTTYRPKPHLWEHPDRSNRAVLNCFCPDQHRPSRERVPPLFCTT